MVNCPGCKQEVQPGARFCAQCGTQLMRSCPACGALAAPEAKFCSACSEKLPSTPQGQPSATPTLQPPPADRDGERRQLTVMFCDIAGSTALSQILDPEDLRTLLRSYQEACAAAVAQVDGYVAKYMGDGVMAYFGYPRAHGDDARRAVLAGLDIVRRVRSQSHDLVARTGRKIKVRIGIHTGLVVTGELGGGETREQLGIVGETPNIAARLQAIADRNGIVISADTRRLVANGFALRSRGRQQLKGVAEAVEVFEVEGPVERAADSPMAATPTPIAGREHETAVLIDSWREARGGNGQAVLVSGEAGIGKSRLIRGLHDAVGSEPHGWFVYQCSPFFQNTAFFPVVDFLNRSLSLSAIDDPAQQINRIRGALRATGLNDEQTVGVVGQLLGIPSDDPRHAPDADPARRRRRTMETLLLWLVTGAARRPTVIVFEDLHWADSSTLELLGLLLDQLATARLLAVMTFRPEFQPPWPSRSFVINSPLRRLGGAPVAAIAHRVAGAPLPDAVVEQILLKTDGVPLFVEELTKTIVETGQLQLKDGRFELAGPLPTLAIPATLRDSLTARLDQLSSVKVLTQLAATLGREFDYGLLASVWGEDRAALDRDIKTLVAAEILYQRGLPPSSSYIFKHALIQDAAYESLLRATRLQYHRRIAEAYEAGFPEIARNRPELVARHFTEAGAGDRAGAYWEQAGDKAVERWANTDAIAHYRKALEAIEKAPPSPERDSHEIAVLLKLGPAVTASAGMGAPELGTIYRRAAEIGRQRRLQRELCTALWGNWLFLTHTGTANSAAEQAEEIVAISEQLEDDHLTLQSFHARWTTANLLGRHDQVREDTAQGIALYDSERHHRLSFAFGGHDPGVCALGTGATARWLTGRPQEALVMAREALDLGERLGHPFSRGVGMWFASMVQHGCGALDEATRTGKQMIELADVHKLAMISWFGRTILGRAQFDLGERELGLALMEHGVRDLEKVTGGYTVYFRSLLSEAYWKLGRTTEALARTEACIADCQASGRHFFLSEMLRIKGNCLLALSPDDTNSAEAAYREAMSVAERQGAITLQLRSALSLARLWDGHGRTAEGQALVGDISRRFPPDAECPELSQARALTDIATSSGQAAIAARGCGRQ